MEDTSHTHFSLGQRQLELKYYLLVFQKIHIAMYMHPAYAHIKFYVVYRPIGRGVQGDALAPPFQIEIYKQRVKRCFS